jgi:hypothetical protein
MNTTNPREGEKEDRTTALDAVAQAVPVPHQTPLSTCADLESVAPYSGSDGAFGGAGASEGWSNCEVGDTVSSAAEVAGSVLVDVISGLSPF